MATAESLVAIFQAITNNLQQDREDINELDKDDKDTGDNMVANFELVTRVLQQALQSQEGAAGQPDVGAALRAAAAELLAQGKGATAPIYARGLDNAGEKLGGKTDFNLSDLAPLLESLLGGAKQAGAEEEGKGGLLDVLSPGISSYLEARNEGASEVEAVLEAVLKLRRSVNRTARSSQGYGKGKERNTQGEIDPGAAGAASLLEGIFGTLLESALSGGKPTPRQEQRSGGLGALIGALFGRS